MKVLGGMERKMIGKRRKRRDREGRSRIIRISRE